MDLGYSRLCRPCVLGHCVLCLHISLPIFILLVGEVGTPILFQSLCRATSEPLHILFPRREDTATHLCPCPAGRADGACGSDAMCYLVLWGSERQEGSKVLTKCPSGLILSTWKTGRIAHGTLEGRRILLSFPWGNNKNPKQLYSSPLPKDSFCPSSCRLGL